MESKKTLSGAVDLSNPAALPAAAALPAKVSALSVALAILLFVSLGWYAWNSLAAIESLRGKEMRLLQVAIKARQARDDLELSARMAIGAADPRWLERYREASRTWGVSIAEARSLDPELFRGKTATGLIEAAAKASEMENEAFLLARNGKIDLAMALLFSEPYETQLRVMSGHRADLADSIRLQIESNLKSLRIRGILALSSFFLILPVILFTWIFGVQVTARHIARRRRAEEALRESEERFRTMADHAPILIWMAGTDQDCTYFNRGWLEFTGRTLEQEAGTGWMEGVYPEDLAHCRKVHAEAFAERLEFGLDYRLRRSDGEHRWIFDHGTPRFLPDGRFAGYIGCCTDVTERRRAEEKLRESEQRLRTVFEGIDDALLVHDLEGRILDGNPAARRRLGYTRDELLTLRTADIESPEFAVGYAERVASQQSGQPCSFEGVHVTRDGRRILVDISSRLISYQGKTAVLAAVRDITERKRVEAELERTRAAAEAANAAKGEFLANMSHEIRTPMNGILGMTDLALDTELTAEQRDYLGMVKASADSLLTLIGDILDFSKIEAGKLDLEPIDFQMRDALADILKSLAVKAHQKGLDLAYRVSSDVPDGLVGDPGRLRQVLVNLVGNAIKFTPSGEVVVGVELVSKEGSEVELQFTVSDTGIGIAPEKVLSIFQPFTQGDGSITRRYGGTGLGLAISARLVTLMGGNISVSSNHGNGSKFFFTARFGVSAAAEPKPAESDDSHRLNGVPVLVADGNRTSREILVEMLSSWGMKPAGVDSTWLAIAELESTAGIAPYSLLILDARTPGMEALQLVKRIRHRMRGLTIIVLVSAAERAEELRNPESGVAACLQKPVKQSELLDTITTALETKPLAALSDSVSQVAVSCDQARYPRRILLAEDNPVNQKVARRLLEKRGHTVSVAVNGREALEMLDRESFDLVLMDVQMPEMGGFEATAAIRAREVERNESLGTSYHIPIVAITANAMKGDRERCLEAGMDGYVAKPVRQEELFAAIEKPFIIQASVVPDFFDCDADLLVEIVNLFLTDCPKLQAALEGSVATRDCLALERAAHTLAGSVANFGAGAIVNQARVLESKARSGDLTGVASDWVSLRGMIEEFLPALHAIQRGAGKDVTP